MGGAQRVGRMSTVVGSHWHSAQPPPPCRDSPLRIESLAMLERCPHSVNHGLSESAIGLDGPHRPHGLWDWGWASGCVRRLFAASVKKLHKAEDSLAVKSPKASTASASEKTCAGLVGNRFDSQSEKALALGPGR